MRISASIKIAKYYPSTLRIKDNLVVVYLKTEFRCSEVTKNVTKDCQIIALIKSHKKRLYCESFQNSILKNIFDRKTLILPCDKIMSKTTELYT